VATVSWRSLDERVRIPSKWVTLIGEKWLTDTGETLEYWRVEKADSVIVLPLQGDYFICLPPTFRVGAQRATVDFPGGQVLPNPPQGNGAANFDPGIGDYVRWASSNHPHPLGSPGISALLGQLECLQCPAVLLKWLYQCQLASAIARFR
jgi:hypothetical protein